MNLEKESYYAFVSDIFDLYFANNLLEQNKIYTQLCLAYALLIIFKYYDKNIVFRDCQMPNV